MYVLSLDHAESCYLGAVELLPGGVPGCIPDWLHYVLPVDESDDGSLEGSPLDRCRDFDTFVHHLAFAIEYRKPKGKHHRWIVPS